MPIGIRLANEQLVLFTPDKSPSAYGDLTEFVERHDAGNQFRGL